MLQSPALHRTALAAQNIVLDLKGPVPHITLYAERNGLRTAQKRNGRHLEAISMTAGHPAIVGLCRIAHDEMLSKKLGAEVDNVDESLPILALVPDVAEHAAEAFGCVDDVLFLARLVFVFGDTEVEVAFNQALSVNDRIAP